MKERDLHPKMCKSEVRKYNKRRVVLSPTSRNKKNTEVFKKSYFGEILIKINYYARRK